MRVAVALPGYERTAAHRVELDAALDALAETGVEVEGFAESSRVREGARGSAFPVVHYLRMAQRHRARPFDAALYPLGRDYRPCEPSWLLARQFPSVVWVLDAVLHHLAVAGMSLRGRWDAHLDALRAAFGRRSPRLAHMTASWWTTPGFYGRFDPVPALLCSQRRVLVTSEFVCRGWNGPRDPTIVPLPVVRAPHSSEPPEPLRLTLLAWRDSRPEPVLYGLRELLRRRPKMAVRVFVPELPYEHRVAPAARRLGGLDRVDWRVTTDRAAMTRAVDDSALVACLRADPTSAELAMLRRALARRAVVLALECPALEEYPPSVVVRIGMGWELAEALPEFVDQILADESLRQALGDRGVGWLQSLPGPDAVARQLRMQLEQAARAPLARIDLAAAAREQVQQDIVRAAGGLSDSSRRAVGAQLREALGTRWVPDVFGIES